MRSWAWFVAGLFLAMPLAEGTLIPTPEVDYWEQAGIDASYARLFIKNENCTKDETWNNACRRGIKKGLVLLSLSTEEGAQLLDQWNSGLAGNDFEKWIDLIDKTETAKSKAKIWG